MFLPFVDFNGNVTLIRPEHVVALRAIPSRYHGKLIEGTLVVLDNRETFRIQGSAEQVMTQIEKAMGKFAAPVEAGGIRRCANCGSTSHDADECLTPAVR